MAETISPCSKLSYLIPDHNPHREGTEPQSPKQQVLLCLVRENDLTKLGLASGESSSTAGPTVVGEAKAPEASPPQPALTARLWQAPTALTESLVGTTAVEILGAQIPTKLVSEQAQQPTERRQEQLGSQSRNSIPDDLLIFGNGTMSSIQEPRGNEANGQTWGQWAAEKALAAESVAAQGAVLVKDSAVSTVKYVTEAASSKMRGNADPEEDNTAKEGDGANGLRPNFVQDVVERYSTTSKTSGAGERSVTRAPTITERTMNMAQGLKESTASALTPGEGDKELAKTITASLSSLPTLVREKMWVSEHMEDSPAVAGGVAGVAAGAALDKGLSHGHEGGDAGIARERGFDVDKAASPTKEDAAANSTKATDEEKLDSITPEKLRELWTIGSGNLDVKDGPFESETVQSPPSPKTPSSTSAAAAGAAGVGVAAGAATAGAVAASQSHKSPTTNSPRSVAFSPETKPKNEKAAAMGDAHRTRVISEANAYMDAEFSKAESHAQKLHAKAESQRLRDEAKAVESLKEEERRAELVIHNAEVKAGKILADAKSTAGSIEASAEEEYAKTMADTKSKTDSLLAEIEETKQKEIAEIYDRVEQMILMKQFPLAPPEHKKDSVVKKVKSKVMSHVRGY